MKKTLVLPLILGTLSLSLLSACGGNSNDNDDNKDTCDPEWEDCDKKEGPDFELKNYTDKNYSFDSNSTNEEGSISYEIFVRSFYDSNGDGIGDLNGVTKKLDYLKELGVKTLWLMPIMPSPTYHGYDVIDYYSINEDYGTLDDFKNLVSKAKEYNIDIMIDIVFNHSSTDCEWFKESYEDFKNDNHEEGSKIDWYNWSETGKSGYNRYLTDTSAYYESRFSYTMPDFNTRNEEVRKEMVNILDYWIDLGVKGFRFDAVKYYEYEATSYNSEFLTYLKENIKDQNVYFVGEAWANIDIINDYYKSKCDSFFKFNASLESSTNDSIAAQVKCLRTASAFCSSIESEEKILKENNPNGYSSYFLSNHDMNRSSNSFVGAYAKMAASLYMLLPGTPYIYYGEEIGLKGVRNTNPDDQTDVMRRLPMVWSKSSDEGECNFPEKGKESLAKNLTQVNQGADDLLNEGYSLTNHYKKIANIRNKYPFIKMSTFKNYTSKISSEYDHVLVYKLINGDDSITVIHNFESNDVEMDITDLGSKIVDEVSVTQKIPEIVDGKLRIGSCSTVILQ